MQPVHGTNANNAVGASRPLSPVASCDDITLDDVRREVGNRWDCSPITGGYKATIREPGGTPIPRYGRTPAELAESIRMAERQP
jgi:hypothetical protein